MTLHDGKSNIASTFQSNSYFIKRIYTPAYKISFYFSKNQYFQVGHRPGKPKIPENIWELQNTLNIREILLSGDCIITYKNFSVMKNNSDVFHTIKVVQTVENYEMLKVSIVL